MFCVRVVRRILTPAVLAAAAVLASCAPEWQAPEAQQQPPQPPPSVGLSSQLIEQASAYRAYVTRTAQISPLFSSGQQVADGVRTGAAHHPEQLLRGAIAYGAVAALQDPTFVAAVRAYAADPGQRQTIAYEILKNPDYVTGISGAASAAGLVAGAISQDGRALLDQGRAVKQAAYDVQKYAWSKTEVAGREARLQQAKQLSVTPTAGEMAESARLQEASVGAANLGLTAAAVPQPIPPLVVRSLAVAALAALGYADDAHVAHVSALMVEPTTASCLHLSKLALFECLAVAKPYYEDVFCLGQHAMEDTGACLLKSAGQTIPPDPFVEAAKARAAAKAASPPTSRHAAPHGRR
jgi:hypothetical protein